MICSNCGKRITNDEVVDYVIEIILCKNCYSGMKAYGKNCDL